MSDRRSLTDRALVTYEPLPRPHEQSNIARKPLPAHSEAEKNSVSDVYIEPSKGESEPWYIELSRWWLELVACLLSVVALIAIIIVLKVYEGRSIDNLNLPSNLTLNGLIAAIATFDRIFLIIPIGSALSQDAWLWFEQNGRRNYPRSRLRDLSRSDAASRGPWGSLVFALTSPYRYLSFVGAVISICSLAISTFTQQLIVIRDTPLVDPTSSLQPGNIARSEDYSTFGGQPAQGQITIPLNTTAAMYNGLISASADPIQPNCPTGNCSWPITPSLAVCGGCAPIYPISTTCNATYCNITMPSGSVFSLVSNFSATGNYGIAFQSMLSHGQHWNTSVLDHAYIANFDMMGSPSGSMAASAPSIDAMKAVECALWMCVNAYQTTVSLGKQTQTVVSTFHDAINPALSAENYTLIYPDRMVQNDTAGSSSHTNYTVAGFAQIGLSQLFSPSLIDGTVLFNLVSVYPSSTAMNAIWSGWQDPQSWIQAIATSMSNAVRMNEPSAREEFNGTAYVQSITVQWWWLSLPVASVAGSILLLLAVMFKTARTSVPPWRSNTNALLIMDMDDDVRKLAEAEVTRAKIDHELRDEKVVLKKTASGAWMLESSRT